MYQNYGSLAPVPAKGGNLKYIATGLFFLAAAGSLWLFLKMEESDAPVPIEPKPKAAKRVNPLAQQEYVIEEAKEEPEPEEVEPEPKAKKPRVRRNQWECSGDLPTTMVRKVIAENRRQVRTCYERSLKRNNVLQGSLNLKLKVNGLGKTVATTMSGSLRDNEVFSCVRSLAESWSFPEPSGGDCAVLQIPFKFAPRED